MVKLKEKWFRKWFDKEISKTEMYFVNELDHKFDITRIRAKVILDYLMYNKIKLIYSFTKNKQSYSLNKMGNKFLINTPHLWFQFKTGTKKVTIFNFMNQNLNIVKK